MRLPTPRSLPLLLIATAAGAGYALGFPPFGFPGAAVLALIPLFAVSARLAPGRAAIAGWLWTTAAALALGHWLPATIARYFEVPVTVGWLALLAVAWTSAGLPIAACSAWVAWCAGRGAAGPLAVGAAFGLTEVARTHAWPPLPWTPLASSALPDAWVQTVDALGLFGLGMLVAGLAAGAASLFAPTLRTRRAVAEAGLLVLLAGLAFLVGSRREDAPEPGEPLRVAAIQPGTPVREELERHVAALSLTRTLLGQRHDLVVWPEHAVGFYLREPTPGRESVLELSRELHADLVLGGPHYRFVRLEPRYFASAFLLQDGELRGRHDKTRLVPFAEQGYAPGERLHVLHGSRARVGALVCAELLFPGVARALAREGAEVLANPSNDAWLVPPAAEHLLRFAVLRAIENRRPIVRATPTGVSAVVDARGHVLARSRSGAAGVIGAAIAPGREPTLTQRFGDWPVGLAALAVVGTTARTLSRRRPLRRIHV